MLGLVDRDVFADEISLFSQLAASRDNCISDTMQLDLSLGKEVLLECIGGKKPDTHINGLDKVGRLSRMLRWLASSGLPDDFNRLHGENCKWAFGSCFAIWWQRFENHLALQWVEFIIRRPIQHLSLHFDGVRVDLQSIFGASHNKVEDFCEKCMEHLKAGVVFQSKSSRSSILVS